MTLVAALALALQLLVPTPHPVIAAPMADVQSGICHSEPSAPDHEGKHGAPAGKAGCDWCVLCGKLGTAVGPLDRIADVPQRALAPVALVAARAEPPHGVGRPRTGPVGARAPPEVA